MTQSGYYIELPDSDEGHRHHTNAQPVVIKGSLVPLRPGVGEVIVIEHPADMATSVRAVPATNWVQVEARVAGAISEREYALLLACVPGIAKHYVTAARRRAMGPSKLEMLGRGSKPVTAEISCIGKSSSSWRSWRVVEGGGGSGEIGSNLQLLQLPPTSSNLLKRSKIGPPTVPRLKRPKLQLESNLEKAAPTWSQVGASISNFKRGRSNLDFRLERT